MSTATADALAALDGVTAQFSGKKSDFVYGALKRAIVLRQLPPETQLLEQELARHFSCSQSTVRESLLGLAQDGLVTRSGYRGTRVTDISREEAAEMVRVRLSIERSVADGLAPGRVEASLGELERIIAEMDQANQHGDLFRNSDLDRRFHAELARAAGMALLSPILERCALHIHRFTLGGVEVPREYFQESGVAQEHRELLAALTTGSRDAARAAMAEHLHHVLERWAPSLLEAVGPESFVRQ